MFNKALEIIEAMAVWRTARTDRSRDTPQSIGIPWSCFRMVLFAQLGEPDMRVPILYAMAYPDRLNTGAAA